MKYTTPADNPDPNWPFKKSKAFRVLSVKGGYWCHLGEHRSAGDLRETPLHETLTWILEQISFGHVTCLSDEDGDVVSLKIGQESPIQGASEDEVAEEASKELLGINLAGLIAECREKGSHPKIAEFEKKVWENATDSARRRMEIHYAFILSQLLGRISKKLPKLQLLPILEKAPANTKEYIAEATRCYLLKLDRACISLCRACLEDTLKSVLTESMKTEWSDEIIKNKKLYRSPNPMHALIEVCARHGILKSHKKDAHDIRDAGNRILHLDTRKTTTDDLAGEVLTKTRKIIGLIYSE